MTYKEVLNLIEYPEDVLVIDFESYYDSDYSLSKMSTIEYVTDERFEVSGCGFYPLEYVPPYFVPYTELNDTFSDLKRGHGENLERLTIVMQNAKFDALILKHHYGINPPYIIDTKNLASHYDARMSHRLKDLAKMFNLEDKGDTSQFKGLHAGEIISDPELLHKLETYTCNDCSIEGKLFEILLPKVTNPEMEVPLARHTLGMYLNPAISFDFEKADRLLEDMQSEMIKAARQYKISDLSGNKSFRLLLEAAMPEGESIPMKQGKKKMIPALAKDDDGMKSLLVHKCDAVRLLATARKAIKSWPLHISRVRSMVAQAKAGGGKLGTPLHYYGGHTGRWSGGEGINLQNLGGRGRAGKGINPLIGQVRELLIAGEGNKLVVADSAQIEARILPWLAGQDDLVSGFANNEDIYSVFATELFGMPVRKPRKSDPKMLYGHNQIKRGFGKDGILGCGYGMGANKFYSRCLENESLRPLFDSGQYDFNFINKLIKTYRSKYSKIPEFWTTVEKAFKWVVKYPHEKVYSVDHLFFKNEDGTVIIRLPSGRCLRYRHASLDAKKQLRYHWGTLWGGSITENIVQSVARDLLGYWLLECEMHNFNTVLHVHDEIVSLVKEEQAESSLDLMTTIMRSGPRWSEGLPLDCEGGVHDYYGK